MAYTLPNDAPVVVLFHPLSEISFTLCKVCLICIVVKDGGGGGGCSFTKTVCTSLWCACWRIEEVIETCCCHTVLKSPPQWVRRLAPTQFHHLDSWVGCYFVVWHTHFCGVEENAWNLLCSWHLLIFRIAPESLHSLDNFRIHCSERKTVSWWKRYKQHVDADTPFFSNLIEHSQPRPCKPSPDRWRNRKFLRVYTLIIQWPHACL